MSVHFSSPLGSQPSPRPRPDTSVGLHTDDGDLQIVVATFTPRIPLIDQRRFFDAGIWAGLRTFRNGKDVMPVLAVRVGGLYFRAPVALGPSQTPARKKLLKILGEGTARTCAGRWTLSFALIDTVARETVAVRPGSVPVRLRREVAAALLGSRGITTGIEAPILGMAKEYYPSDQDLFESLPYTPRIA